MKIGWKRILPWLALAWIPVLGAELRGRVVDRGTLEATGKAKGIAGVKVSIYDGKKRVASSTTNSKGAYRFKRVRAQACRATYRAAGYLPGLVTKAYVTSDTGDRDVYLDAAQVREGVPVLGRDSKVKRGSEPPRGVDSPRNAKGKSDLGYYDGLARGVLALPRLPAYFREDQSDFFSNISSAYDEGDTTADYREVLGELLWAEFLSQDRPVETRIYLAHALAPLLDAEHQGRFQGMERYLEADAEAVEEWSGKIFEAVVIPKRPMPPPQDMRKARVSSQLAAEIAARHLENVGLTGRNRKRFLQKCEKAWGKELADKVAAVRSEHPEEFKPGSVLEKLAGSKTQNPVILYLRARIHYLRKEYTRASELCAQANRLRASYPAPRYLEAHAYLQLGRNQEALGRFQALRESPDPLWKARGYYGLGLIEEKEGQYSAAAADLWKSIKQVADPDAVYLMAKVSLTLTNNEEAERYVEGMLAKDPRDHRAHYWVGKYAELRQQPGVAEDHFRKAWAIHQAVDYGEALAQLYQSREEYAMALEYLIPLRSELSPQGRVQFAECLLQVGRAEEAKKEFAAAYGAKPSAEVLGRYVDALLQCQKVGDALEVIAAFPDRNHPVARFALAKANVRNNEPGKARGILEETLKREENNAEAHFMMGLSHYQEHAYGKAKREFDLALQYRQDYPEALYFSGMAVIKIDKPEAAKDFFIELSQRTSVEWRAKGFLGMGMIFALQGKPQAAENFFQKSLGAKESAEAAALLALSLKRLKNPERWVASAKKAYALDPRHPKAVLAWGECLLAMGKKSQALQVFHKGLAANPNSCDVLTGLAKSQYLMGQYQGSRATSASAISLCPDEAQVYYYAAVTSDKLQNRKEASDYFKAYRRAGGDADKLPREYR